MRTVTRNQVINPTWQRSPPETLLLLHAGAPRPHGSVTRIRTGEAIRVSATCGQRCGLQWIEWHTPRPVTRTGARQCPKTSASTNVEVRALSTCSWLSHRSLGRRRLSCNRVRRRGPLRLCSGTEHGAPSVHLCGGDAEFLGEHTANPLDVAIVVRGQSYGPYAGRRRGEIHGHHLPSVTAPVECGPTSVQPDPPRRDAPLQTPLAQGFVPGRHAFEGVLSACAAYTQERGTPRGARRAKGVPLAGSLLTSSSRPIPVVRR